MPAHSNHKTQFDLLASATDGEAVTPSDSAELTRFSRGLWIGTSGNVTVVTTGGSTLTFNSVPVGMLHIQCKQVKATGTTASNIVAVW